MAVVAVDIVYCIKEQVVVDSFHVGKSSHPAPEIKYTNPINKRKKSEKDY